MQQDAPTRNFHGSLAEALASVRGQLAPSGPVRFPGEDAGRSLSEMAQHDLDSALQLLADRAQYITGASGAAIALRRDGSNDMLCRASTGSNAPELGALLSTEFGLSGESVRTRQALCCDDAERDSRVNRDVCRRLGIASVVVMPVVNDEQVLGVFELFSGEAHAFGERDLSAMRRLSEMVETAVRMAEAVERLPEHLNLDLAPPKLARPQPESVAEAVIELDLVPDIPQAAAEASAATTPVVPPAPRTESPVPEGAGIASVLNRSVEVDLPPAASIPSRPLFWSAAASSAGDRGSTAEVDQSRVPPVMRSLRKCEACGFPVSAARTLCVECEEKNWKGQLKRQSAQPDR